MATIDALTFDIDLNTEPFERGAQNVDEILRRLLGGAFQNLAASIEGIAQSLKGVTDASGEMSHALTASEQGASAALGDLASEGDVIEAELVENAQVIAEAMQSVIAAGGSVADAMRAGFNALTATMGQAVDATKKVGNAAKTAANEVKNVWEKAIAHIGMTLRVAIRSFLGPIAALFGVTQAFSQYTANAEKYGKLSKSLNLDVGEIQGWSEAVTRAGGSAEGFQASLQSLSRQAQNFGIKWTKSEKKNIAGAEIADKGVRSLFKSMGIQAVENGKPKDALKLMTELAGAAEKLGKGKFSSLATRLGVDRGTIAFLQMGRTEVQRMVRYQKDLGVYTKEDARIVEEFKNAMADLGQVVKAFSAITMRLVTPAITAIAKGLTSIISFLRKHEHLVTGFIIAVAFQLRSKLIPAIVAAGTTAVTWMKRIALTWKSLAASLIIPVIFEEIMALLDPNGEGILGLAFDWLYIQADDFAQWCSEKGEALSKWWDEKVAAVQKFFEDIGKWFDNAVQEILAKYPWLKMFGIGRTEEEQKQIDKLQEAPQTANNLASLEGVDRESLSQDQIEEAIRQEESRKRTPDMEFIYNVNRTVGETFAPLTSLPAQNGAPAPIELLEMVARMASQKADEGVVTEVNKPTNIKADAQMNATFNVTDSSPKEFAESVNGHFKGTFKNFWGGVISSAESGQYGVGGGSQAVGWDGGAR